MKRLKLLGCVVSIFIALTLTGCGQIETGDVGVRTAFGKIQPDPEPPGVYTAIMSHVDEYTVKKTSIVLDKLTPKAKDKLMLKELDVTIYYKMKPNRVVDFVSTHAAMSAKMDSEHFLRPGYFLIENVAKGVISDEVSMFDSMTLHQNRLPLEVAIRNSLATSLEKSDPGYFEITDVVVSTLLTDPSIEESIRKNLTMSNDIDTATKNVNRMIQEAAAMTKTANALTPMILQHEYIEALKSCADNPNCTLVVDDSSSSKMLNITKR
jgi:hypothetical protein